MLPALSRYFGVRADDLPHLLPDELDAYLDALTKDEPNGA